MAKKQSNRFEKTPKAEPVEIDPPSGESVSAAAEPVSTDLVDETATESEGGVRDPLESTLVSNEAEDTIPAENADTAKPAGPVTMDQVIAELPNVQAPARYRSRNVDEKLTDEQAKLQLRIAEALARLGVPLRRPGQVYAFLLDQVAQELNSR